MQIIQPILIPLPMIFVGLGQSGLSEKSDAIVSLAVPDEHLDIIYEQIVKPHARPENFFIGHRDNGNGTVEIAAYVVIDLDHWIDIPGIPRPLRSEGVLYRYVIGNEADITGTFFQAFDQRRLELGYFIVLFSPVDEGRHAEYLVASADGWFIRLQKFHGPEIYQIMSERLGL